MPSKHLLNKSTLSNYMTLDTGSSVQAMYIWIDGTGETMRCKSRVLAKEPVSIDGECACTVVCT